MHGFTSVTYQQPQLVQVQVDRPEKLEAAEQVGAGIATSIIKKTLAKSGRVASRASKAGKAVGEALSKAGKYVPIEQKLLAKTAKAGKAASKKATNTVKNIAKGGEKSKRLYPKLPKNAMDAAGKGTRLKNTLAEGAVKTGVKAGKALKSKNLSKIVNESATTGKALKGVAKETLKRTAKGLSAAAAAGLMTAGATTAYHYMTHVGEGGEPLSGKELTKLATDAGLDIVKKGLDGNLSKSSVQESVINAYNDIIIKKKGGKTLSKKPGLTQTLGRLHKLIEKLNRIHWRKHYEVNGEEPFNLIQPRAFGSGVMAKKKRGAKCRRSRGRKNTKKSRKTGKSKKRARRSRGGRAKRTQSKLIKRMHDMFNY